MQNTQARGLSLIILHHLQCELGSEYPRTLRFRQCWHVTWKDSDYRAPRPPLWISPRNRRLLPTGLGDSPAESHASHSTDECALGKDVGGLWFSKNKFMSFLVKGRAIPPASHQGFKSIIPFDLEKITSPSAFFLQDNINPLYQLLLCSILLNQMGQGVFCETSLR